MTLPYPKIPLCVHCLDEAQRTDTSRNLSDKHGRLEWKCPHQIPYPDGEIYWDILQNQERDSFDNVEELERQLTGSKRKNLRSILSGPADLELRSTRSKIKRALDRILELPGMRLDLRLGNWHKYWALRCDDHVLHHLNHIVRVWDTITSGVPDAKKYADVDTVKTLQLCIPAADAARIGLGMEQNQLFTGIRDISARGRLRQNISSLGGVVIPSMATFHDNMSYLVIGLAVLRQLVRPIPKGRTLFQAFQSSWKSPPGKSLQISEDELRSASITAGQAYGQLLLLALRHFPFLSSERPLQRRGGKSMSAGICRQYEEKLDKLARDVGFSLTRTVSRANSEPGEIPAGRGTSTWRGGRPSIQAFRCLREVSFLPVLREALLQPATTPAFVMADFLRSFLGESVYVYRNGFNHDFNPSEVDFRMTDPQVGEDIAMPDAPLRRLPPGGMYANIRQSWQAKGFQPDIPEDARPYIRTGKKRSRPTSSFSTSIRAPMLSTSTAQPSKQMRLELPYEDVQRAGDQENGREQQPGLEDTTVRLPTARGYGSAEPPVRRQKLRRGQHRPDARKPPAGPPGGGPGDQQTHRPATLRPRTRQTGREAQSSQRAEGWLNLPKDIRRAGEWSSALGEQIPQPTDGQAQHLLGSTQGAGARSASGEQEIQPINSGQEDGREQTSGQPSLGDIDMKDVPTEPGGSQSPGDRQDGQEQMPQTLQPTRQPQAPERQGNIRRAGGPASSSASGEQTTPQPTNGGHEDRTNQLSSEDLEMTGGVPTEPVEKVPTPRARESEGVRMGRQRLEKNTIQHSADQQSQIGCPSDQQNNERKRKWPSQPDTGQQVGAQVQRAEELASSARQEQVPQQPRGQEDGTERAQPKQQAPEGQGLRLPFDDVRRAGDIQRPGERAPTALETRTHRSVVHPSRGMGGVGNRRRSISPRGSDEERGYRERSRNEQTGLAPRANRSREQPRATDSRSNTEKNLPVISSRLQRKGQAAIQEEVPNASQKLQKPPPKGHADARHQTTLRQLNTQIPSAGNMLSSMTQKDLREKVSEPPGKKQENTQREHITPQATVSTAQTEERGPRARERQPEYPSLAQSINDDIRDMLSETDSSASPESPEISSDDEAAPGKAGAAAAGRPDSDGFDDLSRQLEGAWH